MKEDQVVKAKLEELLGLLQRIGPESDCDRLRAKVMQIHAMVYPPDGSAGIVAQIKSLAERVDQLEAGLEKAALARKEVIVALIGGAVGVLGTVMQLLLHFVGHAQ